MQICEKYAKTYIFVHKVNILEFGKNLAVVDELGICGGYRWNSAKHRSEEGSRRA